jgi:hypothetical protein
MDFVILFLIAGIVGFFTFRGMIRDFRAADADDAAFEQRRTDRQERIRQQNVELAHRCLMETCETVCIGNWRGSYGKKN